MPLGVRDVLLVIRAKDQASRQIREVGLTLGALEGSGISLGQKLTTVGTSMIAMGAGLAAVGAGGLAFIHSATETFADFDAASRKTLTQVSGFVPNLKEIEQVALDVGKSIPVPFEQIQPALFDIFSSIPIDNMAQARDVLTEMSKAAVAGATDIQTVARSNFEVMNAFGLKTTDLNRLLDVQFQLVRLGIGDYATINAGIGRLAPTATIAGQSIETMAGALAFATRIMGPGGTAISATSRAFEALANPAVVQRLKAMGIAATDATGNFRPFGDVLGELAGQLNKLPDAARVKALNDLFKGAGGTIQARRFLNEAVMQYGNLKDAIDSMSNSAGSLDAAYAIMADAPVNVVQLLSNGFEELKISIGEAAAPVLLQFVTILQNVLDWFNNLSEGQKDTIAKFILVASTVAFVMGIFIALSGALLLLIGTLMTMGVSLSGAIGLFLGVPAAIVIVIGALTELILHWQEVKDAIHNAIAKALEWFNNLPTWGQALVVFGGIVLGTVGTLLALSTAFTTLQSVMGALKIAETLASIGSAIAGFAESAGLIAVLADPLTWIIAAIIAVIAVIAFLIVKFGLWGDIVNFFSGLWSSFLNLLNTSYQIIQQVASAIADFFVGNVVPALQSFGSVVVDVFNTANNIITTVIGVVVGILQGFWNVISSIYGWFASTFGPGLSSLFHTLFGDIGSVIVQILQTLSVLWSRFQWLLGVVSLVFEALTSLLRAYVDFFVNFFVTVIGAGISLLQSYFEAWLPTFQLIWTIAFETIKFILDAIITGIMFFVDVAIALWDNFGGTITDIIRNWFNFIIAVITTGLNVGKDIINVLLNIIQGDWGGAWDAIKQLFIDTWNGIWAALQAVWGLLVAFFVSLPSNILGFLGDLGHLLWDTGWHLLHGLYEGVLTVFSEVANWFASLPGTILGFLSNLGSILWDAGVQLMHGLLDGIKSGFNAVKDFVGGIAGTIISLKGPPSYDAVMLMENGRLIMQGLHAGLQDGYKDVQKFISSISPDVTGSFNMANNMTSQGALGMAPTPVVVNAPPSGGTTNLTFEAGAFVFPNATDPEGTAKAVKSTLEDLLNEMATR